ncbi:paraneoplastic antigen Ma3-like [Pygocentrus nattereri]|uniref:paraneoplastic antigen Ma3-like n=1 Tax=Pygocentrus nattereri TaxID=42514 RepID=UPI0018918873|nr:paraneoplastic antigen Ma3-like [Pygocentrus nattereri]
MTMLAELKKYSRQSVVGGVSGIIESLKGPGLEIVRALRFTDPEAKPGEYLDALNCAFGSAESGEDLYFSFRLIQQKSGEKLSDFARRLEPFLARVVQKGGIMAKDMDRVRVEQVLRGAVGADLMLLQLRLKERRERPPKFLDLLSEIRAEEEYERSRHKVNPRVRQVNALENVESDNVAIQGLKAELKSLKEQMAGLAEQPRSRAEDAQSLLLPVLHSDDKGYSEAVALQKNVNRVKRKIQHLPVRDTTARVAMTKPHTAVEAKQVSSKEDDYFCYRCGENGHIATKCTLPENEKKVIQKLIASLRKT